MLLPTTVTPTPRPTDGVDIYFEMPGDGSEHANFLRAKMDLEERRMKQINEVRHPLGLHWTHNPSSPPFPPLPPHNTWLPGWGQDQ